MLLAPRDFHSGRSSPLNWQPSDRDSEFDNSESESKLETYPDTTKGGHE